MCFVSVHKTRHIIATSLWLSIHAGMMHSTQWNTTQSCLHRVHHTYRMIGKTGNDCRGDVRPSFYIYIWVGSGKATPRGMWTKCRSFRFISRVFQAMLEIETLQLLLLGNHEGVEVPMNIALEGKIHLFSHLSNFFSSLRLSAVPWRTWLMCKDKLRRWTLRKSHALVTSAWQCIWSLSRTCPVTFCLTGELPRTSWAFPASFTAYSQAHVSCPYLSDFLP